jgi:hypothetical protein
MNLQSYFEAAVSSADAGKTIEILRSIPVSF